MTEVPRLVLPVERSVADDWRAERHRLRSVRPDVPLALALVTDGSTLETARGLAAAGVPVTGLLGPDAVESLAWAAEAGASRAYASLPALVSDRIEAVCVDLPGGLAAPVARAALAGGLSLVLARADLTDLPTLRELMDEADAADATVGVALHTRTWPSLAAAVEAVPDLGPLRQLTVLGWPAGPSGRVELVDLARRLCGDVVAASASPAAMPAAALAPGRSVTLALLTASGATVLVAESGSARFSDASITLVGSTGRLVLRADRLDRADARGVRNVPLPPPACSSSAMAVRHLLAPERVAAATLADLIAAGRVLDVARASLEAGRWCEV